MDAMMGKDRVSGKWLAGRGGRTARSFLRQTSTPVGFRSPATLVTPLLPMNRLVMLLAGALFACAPVLSESRISSDVAGERLEWQERAGLAEAQIATLGLRSTEASTERQSLDAAPAVECGRAIDALLGNGPLRQNAAP